MNNKFYFCLLSSSILLFSTLPSITQANAAEINSSSTSSNVEKSSISATPEIDFSNIDNNVAKSSIPTAPSSIYMNGVYLPFTGTSAPSSMYYQRAAYKRLYRGYVDRDWTMEIVIGSGNQLAAYSGRLWRDDYPLPTGKSTNNLIDNNERFTQETLSKSSTIKKVRITITIDARKTNIIPAVYQYDDGAYRGVIPLVDWTDNSLHPKLHNYICVYEGYVNRGAGPVAKK